MYNMDKTKVVIRKANEMYNKNNNYSVKWVVIIFVMWNDYIGVKK